jgi:hypothetical protein
VTKVMLTLLEPKLIVRDSSRPVGPSWGVHLDRDPVGRNPPEPRGSDRGGDRYPTIRPQG